MTRRGVVVFQIKKKTKNNNNNNNNRKKGKDEKERERERDLKGGRAKIRGTQRRNAKELENKKQKKNRTKYFLLTCLSSVELRPVTRQMQTVVSQKSRAKRF